MPRDPGATPKGRAARAPRRRPASAPIFSLHGRAEVSPGEARLETLAARVAIALIAAALLYIALVPHRIGDYFAETDFYGDYAKGARLIQSGRLVPSRYGVVGPVYEVALALVGFAARDLFLAAKLIAVAAATASLLAWFALLARRADTRLALLGTLFIATNATFFRYGQSATNDALANALQAGALLALLAGRGARAPALAGLLAALAFLTRYNAIYLLPAGLIAIAGGGTLQERRRHAAALFAAGFFAPVVPWVIFSLARGAGFSFQLHHNIAYEVFARARGLTWDEYQRTLQPQFHNLWQVVARDPRAVAERMLWNVLDHARLDARIVLGWPVAAAAALGLLAGAFDGGLRRLWPLWLAGALLFLSLVPAFHSERYSLALVPFYATIAALGLGAPRWAFALGPGRRLWLKSALVLLPLALATRESVRTLARHLDQLPVEVLACADTLRAHRQPGDRVIARKPHVAELAGVQAVPFPFTKDIPQLADYARGNGARWLFVSWPETELRPEYWYLLDTTATIPGLAVRACTRFHPAVLYEIRPGFGTPPAWFANDTLRSMYTARAQLLVDGANTRALLALGVIERWRGRLDRARALLARETALDPRNLTALLLLGDVVMSQGDAAAGAEVFDRALALDPASLEARIGRGWASLIANHREEAAAWWRPVAGSARDAATLEAMVKLYRSLGDREAEAAAAAGLARARGAR